jgi:hypothetical protein
MPEISTSGMGYQIGSGVDRPVLRPVKHSFTDYIVIPKDGLKEIVYLFYDCKFFPDGTPKIYGTHTNMTQKGMLGYPLEFDLAMIKVHVAEFQHEEDVNAVLNSLYFQFIRGSNTPYFSFSGRDLCPYLEFTTPEANSVKTSTEILQRKLCDFALRKFWLWYNKDVTVNKIPIRIGSVESFRVNVTQPATPLNIQGEVALKIMLNGVLYMQL